MNSAHSLFGALLLGLAILAPPTSSTYCPPINNCDICPLNSSCVSSYGTENCVCDDPFSGVNNFHCYDRYNKSICYLLNDPSGRSLNSFHAQLDFFGSAKLVHLITESNYGNGGTCHLRVHGWTTKFFGKFYLKGLYFTQTFTPSMMMRQETEGYIYGKKYGCGIIYYYYLKTGTQELNSTFYSDDYPGVVASSSGYCGWTFTLLPSGFAQVSNKCCGTKFGLRAYHDYHSQIVPGMFFEVCQDNNPTFHCWNVPTAPLCLETGRYGANYSTLAYSTGITDKYCALNYFAMTSSYLKYYPHAPSLIGLLKNKLASCKLDRLNLMYSQMKFAFANPHFIRCIADSDEAYALVLTWVVQFYCDLNVSYCELLIERLNELCTNQFPKIVGVAPFLANNCSSY